MVRWKAWPLLAPALAGFSLAAGSCSAAKSSSSNGDVINAAGGAAGDGGAGGEAGSEAAPQCGDCSLLATPQCLTAVCDEQKGECVVVATKGGEACDDGLFCTVGETCKDGLCGQGSDNPCALMADACHGVRCDEDADACSLEPLPDGTSCAPPDLCVVNAACKAGACEGAPRDCFFAPVPDACHVSACDAQTGECEPVPGNDGAACPNDGDLCMLNKTCQAGACLGGVPKNCAALDGPCVVGACDQADGQCKAQPLGAGVVCQEAADECNTGACDDSGACMLVPTPGITCASKTDACNAGLCSAAGACEPTPVNDAAPCDDGDPCTTGEACAQGACTGGVVNNHVVYFSDSFANNSAGWTFNQPGMPASQEWQIGPATASACQNSGGADPVADHSPSDDNGVAGVAIGGCPAKAIHGYYYLESPVINASVQGSIWLEFWRWLNSDFKPYMQNSVEAWDGAAWVKVWESGGLPPIRDAEWTRVGYDLTAFKGPNLRVRFGFSVQNTLGYTVSSWNIDDVVIANNICK